ncbi:uncharacterized protein [Eucyclogobius newberryi]|uniref:uncharacterized protein n=1 Tax=Eucyclogobius newberryi TaxID=166745 RepID=UPI003B5A471F
MGKSCCAVGCTNRQETTVGVSFYRIPKNPERRSKWLAAIQRDNWTPHPATARLCSEHFITGQKSDDLLCPDYVPSVFGSVRKVKKRRAINMNSNLRKKESRKLLRLEQNDAAGALLALGSDGDDCSPSTTSVNAVNVSVQTYLTVNRIDALFRDNQLLRNENGELRTKLKFWRLDKQGFENNNDKVNNLCGLPSFTVLMALFKLISGDMTYRSIAKFQQFLMVILQIKHGLNDVFLGFLFNVHPTTVSRMFLENIDIMYRRIVPALLFWPDRDVVKLTMPMSFRSTYKNCISIIDCFEIFCERPSDLEARAQTYSQYKSQNTVKYLISITPQGHISFISNGWGGHTSDKHVTEHSGYLNFLLPQDTVLADRGFDIEDSVAARGASLNIPGFTRGKTQLDAEEIERTKNIASVRIHVERVIGSLRQKYGMLGTTIPISMLETSEDCTVTTLDKIVSVACALYNACPPVV